MDKAAAAFGIEPVGNPPPQPDRQVSLHVGDRPRVRRGELSADAGDGGQGDRPAGLPRAAEEGARARAAISASASRRSPSAPATAVRPSRRAAWRSRRAGRRSILSIDPSGFVEARIGSSPHGQGLRTTLAQIIADEIGIAPQAIKVIHGDTDRAPYGWGTFASRSLVISGGATLDRGAQGARQADQDREPHAGSRAGRHRAGRRRTPRSPAPTASITHRQAGARGLSRRPTSSRARSSRASPRPAPTIRPARSPTPATSPSSRSISRPAR